MQSCRVKKLPFCSQAANPARRASTRPTGLAGATGAGCAAGAGAGSARRVDCDASSRTGAGATCGAGFGCSVRRGAGLNASGLDLAADWPESVVRGAAGGATVGAACGMDAGLTGVGVAAEITAGTAVADGLAADSALLTAAGAPPLSCCGCFIAHHKLPPPISANAMATVATPPKSTALLPLTASCTGSVGGDDVAGAAGRGRALTAAADASALARMSASSLAVAARRSSSR